MSVMAKLDVTVVILVHNEAANLSCLLPTLTWAAQILILNHASNDATVKVAQKFGAKIVAVTGDNFAHLRESALAQVKTQWLFYLDADERITGTLQHELVHTLTTKTEFTAFKLKRRNFCYGQELKYGGWEKDWQVRLFKRQALRGWTGEIHESAVYTGATGALNQPLWHFTHQNTAVNLSKSSHWTLKEAQLLAASQPPPVTRLTIWRKFWGEFYRRYYRDRGRLDGMAGFIESFTQACNRAWVYLQVWELQQQPSLTERYRQLEMQVTETSA
jgi:glycosyltransferase involved in cell wall biosynthesis